jgi:hypothetical protein
MYARPRACLNPASHPPPYIRPATRLLYASARPPVARELARLHATAARAPGRSPHPRARLATRDRHMSPQPLSAPTSCTSPAARLLCKQLLESLHGGGEEIHGGTLPPMPPPCLAEHLHPSRLPPWLLTGSGKGEHLTPLRPPSHRICLTKTW